MGEQDDNKFKYSYSAPTEDMRREIDSIRREYEQNSSGDDGFVMLRALDSKVKNIPKAIAIAVGIIGILLFGLGMSVVLVWQLVAVGVTLSAAGIAIMAIAYPLHSTLLKRLKQKYREEILQLSQELLQTKTIQNK